MTGPQTIAAPAPILNRDVTWDGFQSEVYFEHYYGVPHPDDDLIVRATATALERHFRGRPLGDIIDVGTGPSLIPLLCALPCAATLTAYEYSHANIAWLLQELARPNLRDQWLHFWTVARQAWGGIPEGAADPMPSLALRARVVQGSIFDLPAHRWDAATMFFCAESITRDAAEFAHAAECFVRCVKPGGLVAAALLEQSEGYDVGGRRYPAVSLSANAIERVFTPLVDDLTVARVGARDGEIRSGYSGAVFVTGLSRL